MTPTELLVKYGTEARYAEQELACTALHAADLPEEYHAEALRRLRAKTNSLIFQCAITECLDDQWEATPDNSKVQPYKGK